MIEAYKRQDGEGLGANKVGEGSGENEGNIGDIPEPPKTHHKNAFVPKPNHLRNRLDTTTAPPVFPPQTDNFSKPIKFKSTWGNVFFMKENEKPSEEKPVDKLSEEKPVEKPSREKPNEKPHPKPSLSPHYVKTSNRSCSIYNLPLTPVTCTHIGNGCYLAPVTYTGARTTPRLASTTPVTNVDFW
jgi:hypothetical protein